MKKTNSNIFIGYGHFRMFQIYRPASNNDSCSVHNRCDTNWNGSCHIRYHNTDVYTTGKPNNFKGSQGTLFQRNQKHSELHGVASDCMVNTGHVCRGIAGICTMA